LARQHHRRRPRRARRLASLETRKGFLVLFSKKNIKTKNFFNRRSKNRALPKVRGAACG